MTGAIYVAGQLDYETRKRVSLNLFYFIGPFYLWAKKPLKSFMNRFWYFENSKFEFKKLKLFNED